MTCLLLVLIFISPALAGLTAKATPTPTAEITVGALADGYADSMYPTQPYGNRLVLYVGNSIDRAQNLSGPARIYIQFDLSTVPHHAHVASAELALYQMYAPMSTQTYEVHIVESPWNESATNWKRQPSSDTTILSTAEAPTRKDVLVSWNVTSAIEAWVNGEKPNYGFMIRIQNERTGVANEASGFYSREYPKEETKPRLRILCQNNPPFTYLSTILLSGLPANLASTIAADNATKIKVPGDAEGYFLFESGSKHVITADEYVNGSESVRYHARLHSTAITTDSEFTVAYEPQFLITVKSEPPGLIDRQWSGWYDLGSQVETPSAREVFYNTSDTKTVLGGWYVNSARQSGNPIGFTANESAIIVAKYVTMYNVTVSSPYGAASGSGWYAAGSNIEISVTPTYVPANGILGYLGLGITFDHWTGSFESASPTTTITVNRPIQATAVWREDRSRLVIGVAIAVGLVLVLAVLRSRAKWPRPGRSNPRASPGKRGFRERETSFVSEGQH